MFSPSNKAHPEIGRAKDLSAPLYIHMCVCVCVCVWQCRFSVVKVYVVVKTSLIELYIGIAIVYFSFYVYSRTDG
jgi:hypothetical protein